MVAVAKKYSVLVVGYLMAPFAAMPPHPVACLRNVVLGLPGATRGDFGGLARLLDGAGSGAYISLDWRYAEDLSVGVVLRRAPSLVWEIAAIGINLDVLTALPSCDAAVEGVFTVSHARKIVVNYDPGALMRILTSTFEHYIACGDIDLASVVPDTQSR